MNKIEFYAECDRLLEQKHPPPKEYRYRGRWGPREPGAGRYEGYGLIRWFGSTLVHISIYYPIKLQTSTTAEHALELIAGLGQLQEQ